MRLVDWLTEPKRKPLWYWAGGVVLLIVAGFAFNAIVQDQARNTATIAAQVANKKLAKANTLLAQQQHDDAVAQHKRSLAACGRNNTLRRAIGVNTKKLGELALELASSRRIAATLEVAPGLAAHDRAVADGYTRLAKSLTYPKHVPCKKLYPDPFPGHHHS